MTARLSDKQEQFVQAVGQVGHLAGFKIKKASIADDLENVTLTLTFTAISSGWHQESLDFEREDLTVHVDGRNGHVDAIDRSDLQTGDLAETGAEADALIAAEAASAQADPDEHEPKADIQLVGEVAAAARRRRS